MRIQTAAVPPFFKNAYLVSCEETKEAVLIDPGDEVDQILKMVPAAGLTVRAIPLTHAHLDHITGVGVAKAALGVDIWLHRDDQFLYDGAAEQGRMFGLVMPALPKVDRYYEPGVSMAFGTLTIDVLHTPGHCPGGVCLAIGRAGSVERELFVGDTLFAGSIGRTDLPGGDHETLIRSIRDVLLAFPDDTVVHAGHGPATTIGRERATNPFLT
jgi:glyoxylase-like metal-dependent hydrolase (beta-lactamase superfamily II)